MESDREVLMWFHQRLVKQHGEIELRDYMHRLRWIIASTKKNKTSRGQGSTKTCNSFKELKNHITNPSDLEKKFLEEDK